jgi:hypothetical protein
MWWKRNHQSEAAAKAPPVTQMTTATVIGQPPAAEAQATPAAAAQAAPVAVAQTAPVAVAQTAPVAPAAGQS